MATNGRLITNILLSYHVFYQIILFYNKQSVLNIIFVCSSWSYSFFIIPETAYQYLILSILSQVSRTHSGGNFPKLWCGAIFTMCSHTSTLFWSRKTSVIVENFQLSFCVDSLVDCRAQMTLWLSWELWVIY